MSFFNRFFGSKPAAIDFNNITKDQKISEKAIGIFAKKDVEKNGSIIREAANNGNLSCQMFMSQIALGGFMNTSDIRFEEDFLHYTELAAKQGDMNSQYNLAQYYIKKAGNISAGSVISDEQMSMFKKALFWYKEAASNGWEEKENIIETLSSITRTI